jgi:glycosyltransferase involved in cell wall biosynthesis
MNSIHEMEFEKISIIADLRWPKSTGIGRVQNELMRRMPNNYNLEEANIFGNIGSPYGPFLIFLAIIYPLIRGKTFWNPGFIPPAFGCSRSIITIHDLTHLKHYTVFHRIYFNLLLKYLYRRCAAIICVSKFVKDEFIAWSKMSEDRVFVVPNGVDTAFSLSVPGRMFAYNYILYPGNSRKYKNIHRLIEAYSRSRVCDKGTHLVLTVNENPDLKAVTEREGVTEFVHFVGEQAPDDMPALYQNARMIAYVSLAEGFGLPIIEGMAAGVPVVTSNVTSMPEVAGDAALLVDPYSVPSIAEAIHKACTDEELRSLLILKGKLRAEQYSWDASATVFWSIVEKVAMRL